MGFEKRMLTKSWGISDNGKFEYVTLTPELLEGALEVIRIAYLPSEVFCIATGLNKDNEAADLFLKFCRVVAEGGVSIVAIEIETSKIVGVCLNSLEVQLDENESPKYEQFLQNIQNEAFIAYMDNIFDVDAEIKIYERFNLDCFLELMFVTTRVDYAGQKIGNGLFKATIALANALKTGECKVVLEDGAICHKRPKMIVGQLSSNASQSIAKKNGFEKICELDYQNFPYEGFSLLKQIDPKYARTLCTMGYTI